MPRSALAAAFALVMALVATSSPARADELLSDGGFESGVGAWATTHGQLDTVASPVHGGVGAARLSVSVVQTHEVYRSVAIVPGQTYSFSAWILADDPGIKDGFLRVKWLDSTGGQVAMTDSLPFNVYIPEFHLVSVGPAVAPLAARSAWLSVVVTPSGSPTVYLDDFSFTGAIPPPATSTPTPSATPAPTPASTATPSPATRTPSPTPRPSVTTAPDDEPNVFDTLMNGGFETLRDDGSPFAWKDIGADLSAATSPVTEGVRALAITSRSSSTKWAYETVRVQPGQFYAAAGYVWSGAVAETFLRVSWYATLDGSGPAIDSVDSTAISQAGSRFERLATGPVQAPGDAQTAKVRLMLRPGSEVEITAFFDAVSFGSTSARPPDGGASPSAGQGSGRGAGRSDSAATIEEEVPSAEALVERYRLGFANVKPAATTGPAAVSGRGANYDWLAVLGVVASGGVIAFAAFLERSYRRSTIEQDRP